MAFVNHLQDSQAHLPLYALLSDWDMPMVRLVQTARALLLEADGTVEYFCRGALRWNGSHAFERKHVQVTYRHEKLPEPTSDSAT